MAACHPWTKWRPEDDKALVQELLNCKANALQVDSGWKSMAWTQCAEALADLELESGGPAKSADSCQTWWGKVCPCTIFKSYPPARLEFKEVCIII